MKLTTRPLSEAEWMDVANSLFALLRTRYENASVSVGLGANRPIDELWQEQTLPVSALGKTLQAYVADGLITPGDADIFIRATDPVVDIRLCRSSDIHIETDDQDMFSVAQQLYLDLAVWNEAADGPAPNSALHRT